jgi:hypothetical protein
MVNGVGNRRVGADVTEFAEPLDAERVDLAILLGDEDHLDLSNVGIDRYQIFSKVGVVLTFSLATG